MHAVMNTDDGIRVVDADEPSGAGVRLSVVSARICGTDVSFVAAGIIGFIYGHEFRRGRRRRQVGAPPW